MVQAKETPPKRGLVLVPGPGQISRYSQDSMASPGID